MFNIKEKFDNKINFGDLIREYLKSVLIKK